MSKPQVKILIIEDELNQANLIQFNLEQDGYEVYTAKDGEEGLTKAYEILPDLILLDWMIPKMSGPDVCRKIRKSHRRYLFKMRPWQFSNSLKYYFTPRVIVWRDNHKILFYFL